MFEKNADPNLLTHNTTMAALHIAAVRMYPAMVELLLFNKRTDIEVFSPIHGTPLHLACATDNIKVV